MLKRAATSIALMVLPLCAQNVLLGLGRTPADYTSAWGRARSSGDGPFETREQVWNVRRGGTFSGQDFEVHVLFKAERSVEERWVRHGSDLWQKEELWSVLDGKSAKFELLRQGNPLPTPYNVLQSPNTVISFLPPRQEMVAQLQNTLQGPQLLFSSKEWAQAKIDLGLTAKKDEGRLASQAMQSKSRPQWGGKNLNALMAGLRDQGIKGTVHTWTPRTGKGSVSVNTKKGTRLELSIPDPTAPGDPNRILAGQATPAPLKASLRDVFRKFHTQAGYAVPGLIGGTPADWSAERIEGAFADDVLQDLIAMKKLPSEFPLLSWQDPASGEAWDLVVTQEGYRLAIQWPAGAEPK
jgi:hypothetical protein